MSYVAEVLADSPSLYWRLAETSGTLADDATANNRDGTLSVTGVTYSQAGALTDSNTALLFDGSAGALQTAAALNLSAVSAVTVEFWLKVAAWNNTDDLAVEFSANWNSNSGAFIVDPCASSTAFDAGIHCASGTNSVSFTRPSTGVFHHYAFVFKPNTGAGAITAYLDGAPWTPNSTVSTGTSDTTLGNYVMYFMSRAAASLFLNGTLDEVAVYPTELSSARILAHYQAGVGPYASQVLADTPLVYWKLDEASGNFADSSGNGYTAVAYGDPYDYHQSPGITTGYSIFNDTDSRAAVGTVSDFTDPNIWTLEAWVKTPNMVAADALLAFTEMSQGKPAMRIPGIGNVNAGKVELVKSFVALDGRSTITVDDNQWHHIVARRTGGVSTIWIDGIDRSGTMANPSYVNNTGAPAGFGAHWSNSAPYFPTSPYPDSYFVGNLDEIAIYNSALSDARIVAHYQAGIATGSGTQVMIPRHALGGGRW